jgi:hypothetical protein
MVVVDESPGYICPSVLLLDSAERLPMTERELLILVTPLPHSMRAAGPGSGETPVDLPKAVREALAAWDETESNQII